MTKNISPSVFSIFVCVFVCLSVCLSVSDLQVTVFIFESWFLVWGVLAAIRWNIYFHLEVWRTDGYFHNFLFVCFFFVIFISFVNFSRPCRSKQMTQRLEIWLYEVFIWSWIEHFIFFDSLKTISGIVAKS